MDYIEQICDNQEAINKVNQSMIPRQMTSPEADIILACKKLIENIKAKPQHRAQSTEHRAQSMEHPVSSVECM